MCYLFTKYLIPKSTPTCVVLQPKGPFFINGLSRRYSAKYDQALTSFISKEEFLDIADDINDKLESYWPCLCSILFGYFMAIFTFGISVLIPWVCVSEAEGQARNFIDHINKDVLIYRRLNLRLVKKWCVSWLEVKKMISAREEEADKTSLVEMTKLEDIV